LALKVFGAKIFQKNIGAKGASKMLMKVTPGRNWNDVFGPLCLPVSKASLFLLET